MKILVINSGSSSIKYQLFDMAQKEPLTTGIVEKIGEAVSRIKHTTFPNGQKKEISQELVVENHRQGLEQVARLLMDQEVGVIDSASDIAAIGHRVVHGGEHFSQPTVIDAEVKAAIRALASLAPLHNPSNLEGIEVATEIFPDAPQVAVFDTAFHQTMPPAAYRYALPNQLYEKHSIRVYGFHGTSHLFVSQQAINYLGQPAEATNLITIHLGNGCSITAVKGGQAVDTSMGFSPLAGLMMGSRSGDLDPAVVYFLGTKLNMSFEQIDQLLNKESGLLGIAGHNDMRDIESRRAQGDTAAQLALDMYTYRIKKYIGAYLAVLGRVDALVFTAGVGQNSAYVRQQVCTGLEKLGIALDAEKNESGATGPVSEIQGIDCPIKVLIIPTNEELEIAAQTLTVIKN
jgi:acetate kinase